MNPALSLAGVTWTWAGGVHAVRGVNLEVRPGERVLVTGASGCGKSTVLRRAAGLLPRFGRGTGQGSVSIDGRDPASVSPSGRAGLVGLVGQDPGDQIVTGTLADEVAFGPESAGWPATRVEPRVTEMLAAVGLAVDPERDPRTLSGGQQQRLVVAASLATGAPVLLLDEPLAALDPEAARDLLDRLAVLAARGTAIVLVEHRLELALGWASRVLWMADGAFRYDGAPEGLSPATLRAGGLRVPALWEVEALLRERGRSLAEVGIDPLRPSIPERVSPRGVPGSSTPSAASAVLRVADLSHSYGAIEALRGVSFRVGPGERIAIVGGNGAGKSTLLAALAGDLGAAAVTTTGRVVAVPQDPDLSLFCATVADEIAYGPREQGLSESEIAGIVAALAQSLDLAELLDRTPQALSRGQRLRVAVGAALACRPDALILDEPTAGQDEARVDALMATVAGALPRGALIFATHDVRLALRAATRVLVLHDGRLVADVPPADLPAALPAHGPVELPPLAALCAARGLPLLDPADFAARWA